MSLRETVRVIQPSQRRLKIFVDFWNVIISARNQSSKFELNFRWDRLADDLLTATRVSIFDESVASLAGCYIFGSYSKSNANENDFVKKTLDQYGSSPGLYFDFKERVKKETLIKCRTCGDHVSQSSEAGVDVLLTVEMIKHAAMREHDYLALVSSDRDFVPLLSFLKDQGQRVLHVSTGVAQREMRSLSWTQVELENYYPSLCRINQDRRLILTSPLVADRLKEAQEILDKSGIIYEVIDITNANEINDRDLSFLLRNQSFFFRRKDDVGHYSDPYSTNSVRELRLALARGDIVGSLPYVMNAGQMEAYPNSSGDGWVRSGVIETEIWR